VATELRNYCRLLHKIRCDCRLSLEEEMLLLEEHGMATRQLRNRAAMLRLLSNSRPGEAVKIKVEQPPARFSRCFDEIEDRTCLEDKMEGLKAMLGGIELADYKPPEQGYGSKTVAFLNDILGSLNLSGMPSITNATQLANAAIGRGKATPGFILCLELLTSKLDLRILEGDNPRLCGELLLRLLPDSETLKKSLMMSILRVCASNSQVATKLPSFWSRTCEARQAAKQAKTGILGRIGGLISDGFDSTKVNVEFLKNVCAMLQKDSGALVWPERHAYFNFPPMLDFTTPAHNARLHQGLWSLQVPDFSCANRNFSGDAGLLSLQLPAPLASFVEYSDKEGIASEGAFGARFPVANHPAARSTNARNVLQRLQADTALYTASVRELKSRGGPAIKGMSEGQIRAAVTSKGAALKQMLDATLQLHARVLQMQEEDLEAGARSLDATLALADNTMLGGVENLASGVFPLRHSLAQSGGQTLTASIENLVALLMTPLFADELQLMNPLLSLQDTLQVETELVSALLRFCRAGHLSRTRGLVVQLLALLQGAARGGGSGDVEATVMAVKLKAQAVAQSLCTRRAYVDGVSYDPRLLVFEFNCNLILRASQVKLVGKFVQAHKQGRSLCHQLIMGAGKTTVIAPLLAMVLASSDTAVVQVVPASLLEMTRGVMRERFSGLVQKPVYTFLFDRADDADEAMLRKLQKARASRAIIVASPTAIKSFVLKFTEIIHLLEEHANAPPPAAGGGGIFGFIGLGKKGPAAEQEQLSSQDLESYKTQAAIFPKILSLFQTGVLLLDEVDLLLHPLKSGLLPALAPPELVHYLRMRLPTPQPAVAMPSPLHTPRN